MAEYKVCSKCGRTLEVTKNFYKMGGKKEGYRPQCKECMNSWQLDYYDKNRKDRVNYQLNYERNKRKINKKYKITKTEVDEIKSNKKYYEGTKEVKTIVTKKTVRNKELRKDYLEYLKRKQKGKIYCEICKKWENEEEMLDVHHKIEISKYEENEKEYTTFKDVIAICPSCHRYAHLHGIEEAKKKCK